jgi:hypothetical protein
MADFTIKRNDRLPKLRATLQQGSPAAPIDLTTASSVKAIFKEVGGAATTFSGTCTLITPSSGIVEYAWASGDTAVSGTYQGEFEIDWGAGLKETVPNDSYFTLTIVDDLG